MIHMLVTASSKKCFEFWIVRYDVGWNVHHFLSLQIFVKISNQAAHIFNHRRISKIEGRHFFTAC